MNAKYGWLLALAVSSTIVGQACSSDDDPKPTESALYDRLGGHQGIRTAVNAIVAKELMDPEIATLFANVGQAGHPTADQLEECFTNLLGKAAGGAEAYPTTVDGFTCRDMTTRTQVCTFPARSSTSSSPSRPACSKRRGSPILIS